MLDVVIIGGGVTGCLIARALSRYQLSVAILEKSCDIAEGSSKANSGIVHAGYDAKPGSLRARFNIKGNAMMGKLTKELDVRYSQIGSLVVAFDKDEINTLQELYDRGIKNGVSNLFLIDSIEKLKQIEPGLAPDAISALYAPNAGIICPYGLALAACENAVENGVKLLLETEVVALEKQLDAFQIKTTKGLIQSKYIINAAGLFADDISAMLEEKWFSIKPRRGEYLLLDKKKGGLVSKTLFGTPSKLGKGILVTPTVDGNLLLGPTSKSQECKELVNTTKDGLETVLSKAGRMVAGISLKDVITSFSGLRATPDTDDFIVQASEQVTGLIHAAGIDSPGLTSAPAIAERVVEILSGIGLKLVPKPDYNPIRKPFISFKESSDNEKIELIKQNHLYGHIICRCETVTEAEILECIRRSAGARSLDGIKRRVRAGMGRCQGGFCAPKITEILARELGVPIEAITKKGGSSRILIKSLKTQGERGASL